MQEEKVNQQSANSEITDSGDKTSKAILQVFKTLGLETCEARERFKLFSQPNNLEELSERRREALHSQNNTDVHGQQAQ